MAPFRQLLVFSGGFNQYQQHHVPAASYRNALLGGESVGGVIGVGGGAGAGGLGVGGVPSAGRRGGFGPTRQPQHHQQQVFLLGAQITIELGFAWYFFMVYSRYLGTFLL